MSDHDEADQGCPSPGCPEELTIDEIGLRCPMHGPVQILEAA